MDVGVVVAGDRLVRERRREARLIPASVVRASISALYGSTVYKFSRGATGKITLTGVSMAQGILE